MKQGSHEKDKDISRWCKFCNPEFQRLQNIKANYSPNRKYHGNPNFGVEQAERRRTNPYKTVSTGWHNHTPGKKWWTDGVTEKLCIMRPKGFFPGRTLNAIRGLVQFNKL